MNSFPFEFTFLDGPALGRFLDVLSVIAGDPVRWTRQDVPGLADDQRGCTNVE